jgi:hypothetical protein
LMELDEVIDFALSAPAESSPGGRMAAMPQSRDRTGPLTARFSSVAGSTLNFSPQDVTMRRCRAPGSSAFCLCRQLSSSWLQHRRMWRMPTASRPAIM